MVLSGLYFSSWQAWLTGLYFVRKPWGLPQATGYCAHPYVVFAAILNLISYTFWTDFQLKLGNISTKLELSLTDRILAEAVVIVTAFFDIFFRFNFYRLNIRLADLLVCLEQPKYKPISALFRKCWRSHKVSLWLLTIPRYIIAFTIVCAYATITSGEPDSAFFIPRYYYFSLFGLFTAVPNVTSVMFAYDLIVITTFHMLWTFEDYCAHLEDHIYKGYFLRRRLSLCPTPSVRSLQLPNGGTNVITTTDQRKRSYSVYRSGSSAKKPSEYRNIERLSEAEEGLGFEKMNFHSFVERFDWIHGLADEYDRIIGPIILGVVVRCVFSIVHSVNAIMLKAGSEANLKVWYHFLVLVVEASQLVILKLGSEVHERISFWKSKLTKAWLLTTSGGNAGINQTMDSEDLSMVDDTEYDNQRVQDLVNYVCTWDWKVSAGGIFNIDKTLMSGIVSTTLTYVVILFQLHLAETPPSSSIPLSPPVAVEKQQFSAYPRDVFNYTNSPLLDIFSMNISDTNVSLNYT